MSVIGVHNQEFLPSIWTEARSTATLHNERTNVPQIITRSEADAISHNAAGPVRRTDHENPQVDFRNITRPSPENARYAELPRQNYSALAQNQSLYHEYDPLSFNYTITGKANYTPHHNPVVINKII
ncbi:hypothetical protein LJB99_00285 [Deltaproteobacteria bacterium OttesenSCG-928-K17]|nr:hypothetical protein [Deltaproteobacteria bacterium OttesenSCG-928-K17]